MKRDTLAGHLRAWLFRPGIAHRLPGRLRLRFPALKRLEPAQQEPADGWRDVLAGLPGIESVELNLATGSALIRYDAEQVTEAELLELLRAVNSLVLRHWDRLAATPPDAFPRVSKQLLRFVKDATRQRLVMDEGLTIPENVWA
jgi:hypothetical protein